MKEIFIIQNIKMKYILNILMLLSSIVAIDFKFYHEDPHIHNCINMRDIMEQTPMFDSVSFSILQFFKRGVSQTNKSFRSILIDAFLKGTIKVVDVKMLNYNNLDMLKEETSVLTNTLKTIQNTTKIQTFVNKMQPSLNQKLKKPFRDISRLIKGIFSRKKNKKQKQKENENVELLDVQNSTEQQNEMTNEDDIVISKIIDEGVDLDTEIDVENILNILDIGDNEDENQSEDDQKKLIDDILKDMELYFDFDDDVEDLKLNVEKINDDTIESFNKDGFSDPLDLIEKILNKKKEVSNLQSEQPNDDDTEVDLTQVIDEIFNDLENEKKNKNESLDENVNVNEPNVIKEDDPENTIIDSNELTDFITDYKKIKDYYYQNFFDNPNSLKAVAFLPKI